MSTQLICSVEHTTDLFLILITLGWFRLDILLGMKAKRFLGSFIDTPELGTVRILHNHSLLVSEEGFIVSFTANDQTPSEVNPDVNSPEAVEVIRIPSGSFMLPSFCDLHLHAPQFLYQGTGLHLPLMEWLDRYAFRAEERIDADPVLARRTYTALAQRLKEHGTGAVLLFGTIKEATKSVPRVLAFHKPANLADVIFFFILFFFSLILADVMQSAGIRAFIGKLSMDISSRKTYKEASAADALDSAKSFVKDARSSVAHLPPHERLIEPVLTPRFVPTCSDELLDGLGALSAQEDVRVQSHLAEARDQIDWVQRERGISDIDIFDKHNLLTARTIQAHCTFLTSPCLTRLSTRGTGIAHCPLANAYFSARPFALREALTAGVHVGLGTDVAGGYSIDPMSAMRCTVLVSRMREGARTEAVRSLRSTEEQGYGDLSVNWKEALFLATRGGAVTLGLRWFFRCRSAV
ncbi:hypothetical protein EW145_g4251 [Phellinidium pouzarii]|uniref:Amidohydrolase-related domain-containing protein n=1 Tax=Phellinidium pouzarii TaxID=167371 RepID=A0A4S4L4D1_9AGAM|nr:hypothetical protein EW145_g4251 [Phellinidium pouzarii]